jgi:DNA repair protein RadC
MNNNGNKNGNNGSKRRKKLESRILSSRGRSLFDFELLELVLYSTYRKGKGREMSERLIGLFGNISKVINADFHELKNVTGMNSSAIAKIFCIKETLERTLREDLEKLTIIDNKKKLIEYLQIAIGQASTENFRAIFLNKRYRLVDEYLQETGTVDQTSLYIREVIKRAILVGATSIIISHNHPSGSVKPSQSDINITKQLSIACNSMGIELIDHIIITAKNHFSFHENGLL